MYQSPDNTRITNLFERYMNDPKSRAPTEKGFYKYLLRDLQLPAWIVQYIKGEIKKDQNLHFHLHTVLEATLAEGALLGRVKEGPAKLLLKNNYGYTENPEADSEGQGTTRKLVLESPKLGANSDRA